ncbi:hypothetical protein EB821_00385 [Candidatus Marinimicrobia bacterium PRS2]|nr:hypothetical protein EB821_00385 [Candidatus Marinimicrobia bacterium PRS2]
MKFSTNQVGRNLHFQDLMLHRIHEILLVASPYDAYTLEEDGKLTEQILHEYLGMNLSYAPRVWQANTASYAMDLLSRRPIDLIIVMLRISDMDPLTFGAKVKELYSNKPIILLAFDESEIKQLPDNIDDVIDHVFIWTGDSSVFPAIIKCIEDMKNVKRDVRKGNVRAILFIEDTPWYYSSILPVIYKETLFHTKQLMDKSLNDTQRLLHMRGRPKILLAKSYETAEKYFKLYKNNILGIISDIRFPKDGKLHDNAGILFAKYVQSIEKTMPVLLQSNEKNALELAKTITPFVLNKKSSTLFSNLREFLINNLGFGDFVFKTKNGEEISRAGNIEELVEMLETIPEESLDYHASRNHFSNWLAARGEFDLATQFRKIKGTEFRAIDKRRQYIINLIQESQKTRGLGSVAEFKYSKSSLHANFLRIRSGSLGGKARGLAFANFFWKEANLSEKYQDITFRVPKVVVIGTDEFDQFMDVNKLWETALSLDNNRDLEKVFLKGRLSRKLVQTLKELLKEVNFPLAIRSSSLLEDSQYQPLAGMYATYMLPNCHESDKERLSQVCEAVKRVFASTFFQEPKILMETIVHRHEEEKMAVIIMEMVGQKHGEYFYPTFSGVAQSYNYYPVSYMQREEGIAFTAIGLGRTIAEGGKALRFSPKYPNILPQFFSIKATLSNSQNTFYALNLNNGNNPLRKGEQNNLEQLHLEDAELHGVLKYTASVICDEDGIIRDSLKNKGRRVITFSPILKFQAFPLAEILQDILELCQTAMGCPVEIEFAVNMYNAADIQNEFCLLQIKPMVVGGLQKTDYLQLNEKKDVLCSSEMALGDGVIDTIRNIICVDFDTFDRSTTRNIAKEIGVINRQMGNDNPYLLIGPGRWGTADPWLGIPVNWKQISHARVIVELSIEELNPEPSFGSHFFQNVTSLRIGYFTLRHMDKGGDIDLEWLKDQPVKQATKFIRWIQLEEPLHIRIDGSTGEGIILKPQPKIEEIMDEEESSGI